jgi:predicted dehydrogenase
MGETHVNSFKKIEGADVTWVCDIDAVKGKPLAESTRAHFTSDFSQILSEDVDIVDICLPTPLHRQFAVQVLEAGHNLFLEKPLAGNLGDGEAIEAAASKSSGLSMVGHVLRFWPGFAELKQQVDEGAVGRPRHILAYRVGPPPAWADWYLDMKKSNGVIFDLGIHDIDYVRWILGRPKSVFSQVYEKGGVHAHGQVLLDYGDAEALCECSWLGAGSFPFTTYFEVAGPGGLAHVDGRSGNSYTLFGPDGRIALDPYHQDGYARELQHFVECVRDGREPSISISEALETVRLSLKAVESAIRGEPVPRR